MSLRELYQEMILDHSRHPRNFGVPASATHAQHGHNPLCGDKLTVFVLAEEGLVKEAHFEGTGCAISVASASLMTEAVKGKSFIDVDNLFNAFHLLVTEGKHADDIGKLDVLAGVAEFPVRVKCATLAWHTLKAALLNDANPAKTE
jgi:nitrogen fixation protein NifU and related proteins